MGEKPIVLIVEDQPNWQESVQRFLDPGEYEVMIADSLSAATAILHSCAIDVAIVDIRLEQGDVGNTEGMIFLDEMEKYYPEDRSHAIMLSAHGEVPDVVNALTRPSHYVTAYFQKERLYAETSQFTAEVARAARVTRAERTVRTDLPPRFLEAVNVPDVAASLTTSVDTPTAIKDLGLVLRALLLNALPLFAEVKVEVGPLPDTTTPALYVLCWSRKWRWALEVGIGQRGTLDRLQSEPRWSDTGSVTKMSDWSTRCFDGVVSRLPDVSFEQFLTIAKS